jgi:hypothetical protein
MFRRTFYDGTYSIDIFEAGHIGNGSRKGARPILVAAPCRPPAHEENGLSEAGEETIMVMLLAKDRHVIEAIPPDRVPAKHLSTQRCASS